MFQHLAIRWQVNSNGGTSAQSNNTIVGGLASFTATALENSTLAVYHVTILLTVHQADTAVTVNLSPIYWATVVALLVGFVVDVDQLDLSVDFF